MNIDLHTHGKLTKKTDFDLEYFMSMVEGAKKNGLDAFALTEHFNTKHFSDVYETMNQHFIYENNCYYIDGIKVFPGMEVDVKEVGHILLIGDREDILTMNNQLDQYKEDFLPFERLLRMTDDYQLIRIGAHPFRESTPLTAHSSSLLKELDSFDLNGKDLHSYDSQDMKSRVEKWAAELNIKVTAGSDSHHPLQLGAVCNKCSETISTITELKQAISEQPSIDLSPCLSTKVEAAKYVKKTIKNHVLSI
ncbi:histidinol phosphatase-like PHP family hydrolase [Salibacterium salarium]|uniref:PHP domain-containing protein n=1 Tax=Salibacterium salarium TaxID=284579 RepID=UPI00277D855E|nr:PHP-associated domain-containing protein [Salibacterium salarium]MDQ0297775.1 histidinol phosphatase-like PHP family hydrolase [Salibacterium salarium]